MHFWYCPHLNTCTNAMWHESVWRTLINLLFLIHNALHTPFLHRTFYNAPTINPLRCINGVIMTGCLCMKGGEATMEGLPQCPPYWLNFMGFKIPTRACSSGPALIFLTPPPSKVKSVPKDAAPTWFIKPIKFGVCFICVCCDENSNNWNNCPPQPPTFPFYIIPTQYIMYILCPWFHYLG